MNQNESGRQHPAHFPPVERHNEPIIIFITLCSKNRKNIFASTDATEAIVSAWCEAKSWLVGRYMIMPNHLHFFCAPAVFPTLSLKQWVSRWKAGASRQWPCPDQHPVWQRDFGDTQLRRGESYEEKWEYVVQNPVRAGLVTKSEDWPFQGELNVLDW